jgi:hypothetical protein
MANPRVKPGSIFYGTSNKRIGTLQGFKYTITNGSGQELADAGAFNTDGQITTKLQADNISPLPGFDAPMIEDLINQQNASISLGYIGGKIHVIDDMRPVEVEVSGEVASGKQTASFNWQGGKPKLVG